MKEYYTLDVEFPAVDFNKFSIKNEQVCKTHHARLYAKNENIELRLFYDDGTLFSEKILSWSHSIDWSRFGTYLKVKNENKNERLRKIDFSDSKLCGINSSTSFYEGNLKYVIINIDRVKFYWNPVIEEQNTAEFYLNDLGFNVVEPFYSTLFGFDGNFSIKRMNGMNMFYTIGKAKFRPEFNTFSKDDRSNRSATVVKEPKIQFKYTKPVSEEEAIFYGEIVCLLVSFYLHTKINYSLRRIHLPEHTITILQIEKKSFCESKGNLWGFNIYWDLHNFFQSKWQKGMIQNYNLLSKAIELFNQALLVDSNSEFLIRYNIIEICNNLKEESSKFNFVLKGKEKKNKFNSALNLLLETVEISDQALFRNKWTSLCGKLEYKPMQSILDRFFSTQNLNTSEFPITISTLKDMRNNITHGSIEKVDIVLVRKANKFLYRINGILILNLLGIKEWKLKTDLK